MPTPKVPPELRARVVEIARRIPSRGVYTIAEVIDWMYKVAWIDDEAQEILRDLHQLPQVKDFIIQQLIPIADESGSESDVES